MVKLLVLNCLLQYFSSFDCKTFSLRPIGNCEMAELGQFPYMIQLRLKRNSNGFSGCGGSLISTKWVLTAIIRLKNKLESK